MPGSRRLHHDLERGTMHSKFITLSRALDPSGAARTDVSRMSSANFSGNSGSEAFNNSLLSNPAFARLLRPVGPRPRC